MNSSSFINEIKQLFQVYLISVFIRNFVVDMQTKNVKNILTCFVLQHIYFIPFFKPVVWERERERDTYRDRETETDTERCVCVCVCVSVLSAVEGQLNPRDGSIKLNIAPSSPQQPIKQNNTKPNISLPPPPPPPKKKSTPTKNSKQNNFFPLTLTCRLSKTELHN